MFFIKKMFQHSSESWFLQLFLVIFFKILQHVVINVAPTFNYRAGLFLFTSGGRLAAVAVVHKVGRQQRHTTEVRVVWRRQQVS
jgi:hypothetical protein